MLPLLLLISTNALNCMNGNKGNDPKKEIIIENGEIHFLKPKAEKVTCPLQGTTAVILQLAIITCNPKDLKRPKSKL